MPRISETRESLSSTYAPIPTGTPNGLKYYKDDGTWAVPAGGGDSGGAESALWMEGVVSTFSELPSGTYISTPASADVLAITNALDIRVHIAPDRWTGSLSLMSRWSGIAGNKSWHFYIDSSGFPRFQWTVDGSTAVTKIGNAAPSTAVEVWTWLRCTVSPDVDGKPEVRFYESSDGTAWTQLGATQTTSTAVAQFYVGTADLVVGWSAYNNKFSGLVDRAELRDAVDGDVIARWRGTIPHGQMRDEVGNVWRVAGSVEWRYPTLGTATWDEALPPVFGLSAVSYGDSITSANGYQGHVIDRLHLQNYTNRGVSGHRMAGVSGSTSAAIIAATDHEDFDIVTIASATNDSSNDVPLGVMGAWGDSHDQTTFYGAYRLALDHILADNPNARIILCTPLKRTSSDTTVNGLGLSLGDYADAIRALGAMYGLPVCEWYAESGFNEATLSTLTTDGLHPSTAGFRRLGWYMGDFIGSRLGIAP